MLYKHLRENRYVIAKSTINKKAHKHLTYNIEIIKLSISDQLNKSLSSIINIL